MCEHTETTTPTIDLADINQRDIWSKTEYIIFKVCIDFLEIGFIRVLLSHKTTTTPFVRRIDIQLRHEILCVYVRKLISTFRSILLVKGFALRERYMPLLGHQISLWLPYDVLFHMTTVDHNNNETGIIKSFLLARQSL